MAEQKQTKAERRRATGAATKAERKQAKLRGRSGDGVERRLNRLEEAVAAQSELSRQLLAKLDELLEEARKGS